MFEFKPICTASFGTAFLAALVFSAPARAEVQETQSTSSTFPSVRQAQKEDLAAHLGVLGGVTRPEGGYGTAGGFGFDVGVQPVIPFGVGLEYTHYGNDQFEKNEALAKVSYNFGGSNTVLKHSYVGLAAGWLWRSFGTTLISAPMVGFDVPLATVEQTGAHVTLGAVARYEILEGSGPDGLTVNGAMKYWF